MTEQLEDFKISNDAVDDPVELRRRLDQDGYLFIKGLQDPSRLRALRLDMLEVCRAAGWIAAGTELADGIVDLAARCAEGDIEYIRVYHQAYRLESFHRAGHGPEVLDLMEKIIGTTVLPPPQKIARLWFPQYAEHTTPVHQDFVHFQGSYDTYTCWTPLSDCPVELGGLALLPGSHKIDAVHDHHFSLGAGSLAIDTDALASDWVTSDYELGDSLIFHSLTVHRALPNLTEDRLRVSLDNRYQSIEPPIAGHMLSPHLSQVAELTWEEIYRDWQCGELQYYWRDLNLRVLPKDESWSQTGFAEALDRARLGDAAARYYLRRIVKRAPDSAQARAAEEALQTAS